MFLSIISRSRSVFDDAELIAHISSCQHGTSLSGLAGDANLGTPLASQKTQQH